MAMAKPLVFLYCREKLSDKADGRATEDGRIRRQHHAAAGQLVDGGNRLDVVYPACIPVLAAARRLIPSGCDSVLYVDHIEGEGERLFQFVCERANANAASSRPCRVPNQVSR